ncbi:hypothetical protein [Fimbriiglobus ruber]|uniref:DUF1570 domain-containing protein n=1 Tax=Fimbriiglobus ruber TaxID=1908690 RepID=A0A225D922_9BACT|nr:hypothetical protein [Fimbriiglobus ruber]OWK35038.1 hypothetical protein FRUB_09880 [Fimbriiglobus ruber]
MQRIETTDILDRSGEWPIPRWPEVDQKINLLPESDRAVAWADVTRTWLNAVQSVLGDQFAVYETEGTQLLAVKDEVYAGALLANVRHCRTVLVELLTDIGKFHRPGKELVICLPIAELYYSYLTLYFPDGQDYGGSSGVYVKDGYPHIVCSGTRTDALLGVFAHELTHASLSDLRCPLWLEEGITQLVETKVTGAHVVQMDTEDIRAMTRYWSRNGLGMFWWGHGYAAPGSVQKYCYLFSVMLMTVLVEEHRVGLLGFGKRRRERLLAFVRNAGSENDAGRAAARQYLGYSLGTLAAKCLGPGDWEPRPADQTTGPTTPQASSGL